ncbi:MAG: LysR family transcriptional regulator [Oligoflexales bacterium]
MSLLHPNLEAFYAIYLRKTVIAASKDLGISQTGVTQRLRALEREVGASLFTRSRLGMSLTTEGKFLLSFCLMTLESQGRFYSQVKDGGSRVSVDLRIAGPTSFIAGRVVPGCTEVYQRWPHLNLHFMIDDSENRVGLLKQAQADIVVLYPHQVQLEFDSKLVKPDEYCLVGHPSWKKLSLSTILSEQRLFAFHADDQTSLNYLKYFHLLKYLKRPRLFVNENSALIHLLVAGIGVGILAREIAKPLVESKRLVFLNEGKAMKDPLSLAWYSRSQMPAYFQDLLDTIH